MATPQGFRKYSHTHTRFCNVNSVVGTTDSRLECWFYLLMTLQQMAFCKCKNTNGCEVTLYGWNLIQVNSICICGKEDEMVSYGLLGEGSYFCENVGCDHKSNHVCMIANFSCNQCYQKCWDPDCRSFQSRPRAL